ncbi:hypothetical protein EF847_02520 [Actinobacteria bacterium YIM 96077]|uniref:Alpha/beta hydrolase n=1 Tax=Phytoactinopolyspora halophila TaxID=1981511 RepID=A0A329R423_9ACTN|nr:hypothetical protein [Phytoactinopolyspora halophila]AYY11767.1 hypothetical protein EF847_02520 [Actinobacteria bacterium YIM 96077]RAW17798.1 hypothetical protein DPM12_02755 [Phytoactinopolyspora halophila]
MKPETLVVVSGPVDPRDWWEPLTADLLAADLPITAPRDACEQAPYGIAWIASIARVLHSSSLDSPLVIAGHGTAGPLLPALAGTQQVAGRHVGGYVFVDATLPRPGPTSHLDLLQAAAPDEGEAAHEHLHQPGATWPLPPALPDTPGNTPGADGQHGEMHARPRDHDFWTETLPPATDWPDAPCAYVQTGQAAPGCGDIAFWARSAQARGWTVIDDTHNADLGRAIRAAVEALPG